MRMVYSDRLDVKGKNWIPWVTLQRKILSKYHLLPCIDAPVLFPNGVEGNSLRMRDSIVIENLLLNVTPDVRQLINSDMVFECWNQLKSHFQRSLAMAQTFLEKEL